jgi:hypothetical protein
LGVDTLALAWVVVFLGLPRPLELLAGVFGFGVARRS